MKPTLAILLSLIGFVARANETIYLPVHYMGDKVQSCTITFPAMPDGTWNLKTPCYVHAPATVSSTTTAIDLVIDLEKTPETFHIHLLSPGSSNQIPTKVYTIYLSLIPQKYVISQQGNTFHLTNASNQAFRLINQENIEYLKITPFEITGKLNKEGSITLADIGKINLRSK